MAGPTLPGVNPHVASTSHTESSHASSGAPGVSGVRVYFTPPTLDPDKSLITMKDFDPEATKAHRSRMTAHQLDILRGWLGLEVTIILPS